MFFRILKKDMKRKKTTNIILLLFIILATIFVSSGLNNVITVMKGTDYFLNKAGVGDYVLITMGDDVIGKIDKSLSNESCVDDYRVENIVFGSKDNIFKEDGKKVESRNEVIFQALNDSAIKFFNSFDEEIKNVKKGHAFIGGGFIKKNHLKVGDTIQIKISNVNMKLIIDGIAKDALFGSDFMGNTRIILNEEDMQTLLDDEVINKHYQGEIGYIETTDTKKLASFVSSIPNISFDGSKSVIETCYVMDTVVAFIILILSVCLIIVSFVVLKFSISFTLSEEFREIGIMKAIGLKNNKIRSIYILKYIMLALIGAIVGFFISIPFGKLLLQSVSSKMVLGNNMGITINILGALIVIILIIFFAYHCTGKVKKASPIDAIRSGQTGERYKKKTIYRIGKSHTKTPLYLAINDIISSKRRFITIVISFFICTLFVLVLVNTTTTMKSPNLISAFGTKSDLYITDIETGIKFMKEGNKEDLETFLDDKEKEITSYGMPAECSVDVQYKYRVYYNEQQYTLTCQQGTNTKCEDYEYTKGVIPQNKNEIAITPQISKKIGAKIGDTVTIDFGTEKMDCIVTAYFKTLNQLGEIIRLHEDAPTDLKNASTIMQYHVDFTDHPSKKEIENRKEKLKKIYDNDEIMNATEFCIDCIGVVDTMEIVKNMLLAITSIVVLLITILMERSFIANEKSQIAILKAIGFNDRVIIRWHSIRFGLVAFVAVFFAVVLSIPMTNLCISPLFGMMGTSDIKYNIEPLQVYILYPLLVLLETILVAWITSLYTKKIKSSDTADIE